MNDAEYRVLEETAFKLQIQEQLHQWTRGADRIDIDLMQAAFHPKANINYGFYDGPVEMFLPWVLKFHSEELAATEHTIGNLLVRIVGEEAFSEARVDACLRLKSESGLIDLLLAGRYLDKWQRRDGVWKIYDRIALVDFYKTQFVTQHPATNSIMANANYGSRDKQDPSYKYL